MPEGPRLPRKATATKWSNDSLHAAASQIGALVAIQRNRIDRTQQELEDETGVDQVMISRIERGQPVVSTLTDGLIDDLFERLKIGPNSLQANFVKWWRDNH